MSTQLTTAQATGISAAHQTAGSTMGFVAHLEEHWRLAKMLTASGMLPKALSRPEAAMAVLLKAHELNLPAMYAFANLHFFDGRLVESAALMVGMAAERCGVTYEVIEWTDERCELLFHRPGWSKPLPSVFTIEDAKRASLTGKDNWKKYPKSMLLARAQSQGVRAIAPDRFGGMHSAEEVRDMDAPAPSAADHAARITAALAATEAEFEQPADSDYETVEEVTPVVVDDLVTDESPTEPALLEFESVVKATTLSGGDASQRQRNELSALAGLIYGDGTDGYMAVKMFADAAELGKEQAIALLNAGRAVMAARESAGAA